MSKYIVLLFTLVFAANLNAQNLSSCLEKASTQQAMNRCEGVNLAAVNAELSRVMEHIKTQYQGSPEFLQQLALSQEAWQASLQANLAMKFPLQDKQYNYGSVYPMCASGFEARLIAQRIAFLKAWLSGAEEGEVCSGSVLPEYCLQNDCDSQ